MKVEPKPQESTYSATTMSRREVGRARSVRFFATRKGRLPSRPEGKGLTGPPPKQRLEIRSIRALLSVTRFSCKGLISPAAPTG